MTDEAQQEPVASTEETRESRTALFIKHGCMVNQAISELKELSLIPALMHDEETVLVGEARYQALTALGEAQAHLSRAIGLLTIGLRSEQ